MGPQLQRSGCWKRSAPLRIKKYILLLIYGDRTAGGGALSGRLQYGGLGGRDFDNGDRRRLRLVGHQAQGQRNGGQDQTGCAPNPDVAACLWFGVPLFFLRLERPGFGDRKSVG